MAQEKIRNFCILAHIDHGKSTLADRLLEVTETIPLRARRPQVLDSLELERERGVTIKLKAVRMNYRLPDDLRRTLNFELCTLNLIDTPGHLDFGYEVSRSLAACEGALLLVDASQGIQAQTLANFEKAKSEGLSFIPVVNKIDLPQAETERVIEEMAAAFGFRREDIIPVSAKMSLGIDKILKAIVQRIPSPRGQSQQPFRALVFDSKYDEHKGVVAFVRVVDGQLKADDGKVAVKFLGTDAKAEIVEIGYPRPELIKSKGLNAGEIGYLATGLKEISKVRVGDTAVAAEEGVGKIEPLPGYKVPKPMVFASLYPADGADFSSLRQALERLSLNDASLSFKIEVSELGKGFAVGFLGTFHAEIVKERLKREYHLNLWLTAPQVEYEVLAEGRRFRVVGAKDFPDRYQEVSEPWVSAVVYAPELCLGFVLKLASEKRAVYQERFHQAAGKVKLVLELPLAELVSGFYDQLKSVSSGLASLDWEFLEYRPVDAVRLDILVHDRKVPSLSQVVLRRDSLRAGRGLVEKLKETLPRQQFPVKIQAAVGGKIVARETLSALGKNVLAKLSGGHRERKDKVLERQRKGKKRLAKFGTVSLSEEALRSALR